ncbi:WD40-repeat-containing domain protein [Butyriboletus roseoflavus]|nr:WD40-repeat-containing domain protein [Butyriboletus roseoflavus]
MSWTKTVLDANSLSSRGKVVAFHPDGKHVFGGGDDGIRRWRLEDGQEVGEQTGVDLRAISISRDQKWIVCGTKEGASVWDEELQEKVVDVDGTDEVWAVDVSPDSTTFATGTDKAALSIWSITSGKRLVGPLKHDSYATGVRFSPNSERIATASIGGSIRIFDSRNGDELVTINTLTASTGPSTPLAWSNDGQQIFAASKDNKIKLFDVSTGSQLAESQAFQGSYVDCVALAANGKFIATYVNHTILFLDTSTLSQIGLVIENLKSTPIWSIAISPDNGYLAIGLNNGEITIRDLSGILPDSYGPFHVSTCSFTMLACQASLILSLALTHYIRHLTTRKDNRTSLQPRAGVTTNDLTPPR